MHSASISDYPDMTDSRGMFNHAHSDAQVEGLETAHPTTSSPDFDILDWHPEYESCQAYFLDHAQHEAATQALCALINIKLPFQWRDNPIYSTSSASTSSSRPSSRTAQPQRSLANHVSLIPYIRRLVVTGFDKTGILHGFFGDAWAAGITPLQDCERRNYLFAAKHGGWRTCKRQYDISPEETVPFMKPLQNVRFEELEAADKNWSSWLAMEDWMLGPRAPEDSSSISSDAQRPHHNRLSFEADMTDSMGENRR